MTVITSNFVNVNVMVEIIISLNKAQHITHLFQEIILYKEFSNMQILSKYLSIR